MPSCPPPPPPLPKRRPVNTLLFFYVYLQPRYDMLPALDVLKEYLGMMHDFPDLVDIHRGAMRKVRDADKMKEEGRLDVSCLLSYSVLVWYRSPD